MPNGEPMCVKLPMVIALRDCEVTIETKPVRLKMFHELKRVTKRVEIDQTEVGDEKVLITGTLYKNVEYVRQDGMLASRNFELPFSCCIDVPGAFAGDWVQIESAEVVLEKEHVGIPPRTLVDHMDVFEKFWETVCIRIIFKVLRNVQITITGEEPNICPVTPIV